VCGLGTRGAGAAVNPGEYSPTVLAEGPIGRACTTALKYGVDIDKDGDALTGVCGCGHPIAVRSMREAKRALAAHLAYRTEQ